MYPIGLAKSLRTRGFDVLATLEVDGLPTSTDVVVLEWAILHKRAVVTENIRDFARLGHGPHAGIILAQARRWPRDRAGLARLESALGERLLLDVPLSSQAVEWL